VKLDVIPVPVKDSFKYWSICGVVPNLEATAALLLIETLLSQTVTLPGLEPELVIVTDANPLSPGFILVIFMAVEAVPLICKLTVGTAE